MNRQQHRPTNRLQTLLLVATLLSISSLAGALLFGEDGMWMALAGSFIALVIGPAVSSRLTLALYRARPIGSREAPELQRLIRELTKRADLPTEPLLHYVSTPVVNAFAVGSRRHAAIVLTDGLLQSLTLREIAGVLAHEMAHIAHDDLRVMGLADYVSRLTGLFAMVGLFSLILALLVLGATEVNWPGLILLILSPHLALLVQLGLSRVREFDADLTAARLTGDPQGLASALVKIERVTGSWRAWIMPGWSNPEPSWLRTHPATEARIRRLLELPASTAMYASG